VPRGTEEDHENFNEGIRCLGEVANREPSKYKPEKLGTTFSANFATALASETFNQNSLRAEVLS
jgi:hypothetical protein